MELKKYTVYSGGFNQIRLILTDGGVDLDHTTISRMRLDIGVGDTPLSADPHMTIDSNTNSAYFDFSNAGYVGLVLGNASIPKGRHITRMKLHTDAHPNGDDWEPKLELYVV